MEELLDYVKKHWGKLQKCKKCSKEPIGFCEGCCSLVYCSKVCQSLDWMNSHYSNCTIGGKTGREEDEKPEESVKARKTEEGGRIEEREVIDLSVIPKDVLNMIADFLSGRDIRNFRRASVIIEERIRLVYFSKFRIRLTEEILRSRIAPYIQAVFDTSGGRLSKRLYDLQRYRVLKDVHIRGGNVYWDSILTLDTLTHLDLGFNRLTEIPRELGHLSNLQQLYLSVNQLTEIPRELGHLSNLQGLYLSSNQLTAIPRELGHLSNLQGLYLGSNQLSDIPRELGHLSNLQELYLSSNQLTAIPRELGNLSNLQKLDLSSNQLTEIPRELGHLSNLQELYLSYNQLSDARKEEIRSFISRKTEIYWF